MMSLEEFREKVSSYLNDSLVEYERQAEAIDPEYGQLVGEIRTLMCRGGKRIRPYLVYLAYIGCGGSNEEALLPVAASQDIYHNLLLIHDDIIDRDQVRYGGPNISGSYLQRFRHLRDTEAVHYSNSMALLAGDVLYGIGHRAIISADFSAEQRLAALQMMDEGIFKVAGGEVADVLIPLGDDKISAERLERVCHYKTATYTFEIPLRLGVLMSGSTAPSAKEISDVAVPLGIAYQLKDDILGLFGEEAAIGKSVLSDMREGKCTLLYRIAFEKADGKGQEVLARWYGCAEADVTGLKEVRSVCVESGALDEVERMIRSYIKEAEAKLPVLHFSPEVEHIIGHLIAKCINRNT